MLGKIGRRGRRRKEKKKKEKKKKKRCWLDPDGDDAIRVKRFTLKMTKAVFFSSLASSSLRQLANV